jgi:hypothetical protein
MRRPLGSAGSGTEALAMVPSWQPRQIFDVPVGCPTLASRVGLQYGVYRIADCARLHAGATGRTV